MNDVEGKLKSMMVLSSMMLEVSVAAVAVIDKMSKELKAHDIAISSDIKADVANLFASIELTKVCMKAAHDMEQGDTDVR